MSSRSRKLRVMPFLFQMIGGRSVPWMAHDSTVLRPTVTVVTLTLWSSAKLSWMTSGEEERRRERERKGGDERRRDREKKRGGEEERGENRRRGEEEKSRVEEERRGEEEKRRRGEEERREKGRWRG